MNGSQQVSPLGALAGPGAAPGRLDWAFCSALLVAFADGIVDLEARSATSPNPLRSAVVLGTAALIGLAVFGLYATALELARPLLRGAAGSTGPAAALATGVACGPSLLAAWRAVDASPRQTLAAAAAALVVGLVAAPTVSKLLRHVPGFPRFLHALALASAGLGAAAFGVALAERELVASALAVALGLAAAVVGLTRVAPRPALVLAPVALALVGLAGLRLDPRERAPESAGQPAGRAPRHVVLIVVDTLRADFLSCYSKDAPSTPVLDSLAQESLVFEQSRSAAPWTYPSMGSIHSGLLPAVHLANQVGLRFAAPVPTIATRLADAGYLTAAFVRNPVLWRTADLDRGFQEYHFFREPRPPSSLAEALLRRLAPQIYAPRVGADAQCADAARWIDEHAQRDFFLWLHLFDPHMTYEPPEPFQPQGEPAPRIGREFGDAARVRGGFFNPDGLEREWIESLYGGEVRFMDEELARVFDALKRAGIWHDALVMFTADHGEEFWEHAQFEHGHALYDETVKVPWIVKLPRGGALRGRVGEDVCNASVAPTILELCGVEYEPEHLSAPPVITRLGDAWRLTNLDRPYPIQSLQYFEGRSAMVFDGHKYIRWEVSGREELYDLRADPGETRDLAAQSPELLERARALMGQHLDRSQELREHWGILQGKAGELDPNVERDLRALGYVK